MSVTGFIVGAICALIFYIVATSLIAFNHSALLFALVALLLWGYLTVRWPGP